MVEGKVMATEVNERDEKQKVRQEWRKARGRQCRSNNLQHVMVSLPHSAG